MTGKMEELIAAMAEQQNTLVEQNKAQQDQIAGLVDAIKQMPGIAAPIQVAVAAAAADPVAIRADKVQRIALG